MDHRNRDNHELILEPTDPVKCQCETCQDFEATFGDLGDINDEYLDDPAADDDDGDVDDGPTRNPAELFEELHRMTWGPPESQTLLAEQHPLPPPITSVSSQAGTGGGGGGRSRVGVGVEPVQGSSDRGRGGGNPPAGEQQQEDGNLNFYFDAEIRPIQVWPPVPSPFACSCCQIIREIIHTNTESQIVTRLEMHGRIGLISHAILEVQWHDDAILKRKHHEMLNFSKDTYEFVQHFLKKYLDDRSQAGFVLKQDPLSVFYETITVGLNLPPPTAPTPASTSHPPPPPPPPPRPPRPPAPPPPRPPAPPPAPRGGGGGIGVGSQVYASNININAGSLIPSPVIGGGGNPNSTGLPQLPLMPRGLAEKRKMVSEMTFEDFAQYFHLPIKLAAEHLGLCDTTIKRKLREFNVKPWPQRKITCIMKQIETITNDLSNQPDKAKRRESRTRLRELYHDLSIIYRRNVALHNLVTDSDDEADPNNIHININTTDNNQPGGN